jgi:hypothetical protein
MADKDHTMKVLEIITLIAEDDKFAGTVTCPICGGTINYIYEGPMAMRAKCDGSCGFTAFS